MLKDPRPCMKANKTDRACCAVNVPIHRVLNPMNQKFVVVYGLKRWLSMIANFTGENKYIYSIFQMRVRTNRPICRASFAVYAKIWNL